MCLNLKNKKETKNNMKNFNTLEDQYNIVIVENFYSRL